MLNPFNSAWALLKNIKPTPSIQPHYDKLLEFVNSVHPQENTENQSYPLTPEEEKTLQMQNRAYELARGENPQPPNMTDNEYEDAIDHTGESIMAGMKDRK